VEGVGSTGDGRDTTRREGTTLIGKYVAFSFDRMFFEEELRVFTATTSAETHHIIIA